MSLAAPEAETGSARGFPAVSRAQPADQRFHQGDIFPLPQPANDRLDFSHLPANYLFSLNPTIHSLGHFLRSVDLNSIKKEKKKRLREKPSLLSATKMDGHGPLIRTDHVKEDIIVGKHREGFQLLS